MENSSNELAQRVDDIEKTIGDFAQIIEVLKNAMLGNGNGGPIPTFPPTCPPYCAHWVPNEYEDELPLPARVADIRQCIGDFAAVFQPLKDALIKMHLPTCPPYCGHGIAPGKKQSY